MTIISRVRKWREAVLAAFVSASLVAGTVSAQAQLKQVKISGGSGNTLNVTVFYLLLPGPLGYWKEEGYQVEVLPISGSTEAVQQLVADNIEFIQINAAAIVQANTQHSLPVRGVITNSAIGWGIAVKKNGSIKSVSDLKGKTVGIVSLSSGGIPLFNSFLKNNGLDPETDVTLIATGVGGPALHALESDRVQGLMYWSSALAGFENAGAEISVLRDPVWATLPDYTLATTQTIIDSDPKMVEGIARGIAKAMVFAAANPDCARKLIWLNYPDTKPTGIDEQEAVANDLSLLGAVLEEQRLAAKLNPDNYVAAASSNAFAAYQDFLFDAGIITSKVDPAHLVIDIEGFWERVNNFDKAAIEEQAKACHI
jgi:NitT/TauT family transport system substrate-binding protein